MKKIYILFTLVVFISCKNSNTKLPEQKTQIPNEIEISEWENKTFYVSDSSSFKINVRKNEGFIYLRMKFSRDTDFKTEIEYVKTVLIKIEKEVDLSSLKHIEIFPIRNKELFKDFTSIPEIFQNIKKNESENKKWIDFVVVQDNIHKSKLLEKFTELFKTYNSSPSRFTIDKCGYRMANTEKDYYEMHCPRLGIIMKSL